MKSARTRTNHPALPILSTAPLIKPGVSNPMSASLAKNPKYPKNKHLQHKNPYGPNERLAPPNERLIHSISPPKCENPCVSFASNLIIFGIFPTFQNRILQIFEKIRTPHQKILPIFPKNRKNPLHLPSWSSCPSRAPVTPSTPPLLFPRRPSRVQIGDSA